MQLRQSLDQLGGLAREVAVSLRDSRTNAHRHSAHPPTAGLVLDVGSGQAPHPRADAIVDKYVADDFERGSALVIDKPLIVGDGHALPFADGAFGYVVASHVLEHATDPARFAGELQRVASAGFVQVPTREAELTFGWPFHPWLIDKEGEVLVFHPRGADAAPLGPMFHQAFAESKLFSLWFVAHRDRWHHTLHWQNRFDVRVEGASQAPQTAELDVERTLHVLEHMHARGPSGALRAALRCPADRATLVDDAGRLRCTACGRSYPVSGEVPVLLAEAVA